MEKDHGRLPRAVKGIGIVLLVAVFVLGVVMGLRVLEVKQQKPRVLKALGELAEDFTDEKYSLKNLAALWKEDRTQQNLSVNITSFNSTYLDKKWSFLGSYLGNSNLELSIRKDGPEKKMLYEAQYSTYGVTLANVQGYLDEEECMIRIPQFHEQYLAFHPDNVRAQYENSLLYTVIGDRISMPEGNLASYAFREPEAETPAEIETMLTRLREDARQLKELYKAVQVRKLDKKEEILINGKYELCTAYELMFPADLANGYLKEAFGDKIVVTGSQASNDSIGSNGSLISMEVYLSKGRALKIAGTMEAAANGREIILAYECYPKGTENAFDAVTVDVTLTPIDTTESYGFNLSVKNEFAGDIRNIHGVLNMTRPYVTKALNVDMEYNQITGESNLEFEVSMPMASFDGSCHIAALNGQVAKPQEGAVRLFELDLFELLKFTNGMNLNFFGK